MATKGAHLNITKGDLAKMDLGALVEKRLMFQDPAAGTRVWEYEFEHATVNKTEWYGAQQFVDATQNQLKETDGQRFGDTRKIATIPMHIWAREVAPRAKDGNDSSIKKWLNSGDGKAFRVFKGDV